jgi:hypothetical protein
MSGTTVATGVSRFVLGDLLRLVAAASVVAGTAAYGFIGFALFMLVLGGSVLPRALAAPATLDLSYCATLLVAAWAAELDWYLAVGWLDVVVHAAATGLIAAVAHLALVGVGGAAGPDEGRLRRPRLGSAVVTTALGVSFAVVWELLEWFGHAHLDDRIQVGYADTLGDVSAGAVGALVAGVLLARGVLLAGAGR